MWLRKLNINHHEANFFLSNRFFIYLYFLLIWSSQCKNVRKWHFFDYIKILYQLTINLYDLMICFFWQQNKNKKKHILICFYLDIGVNFLFPQWCHSYIAKMIFINKNKTVTISRVSLKKKKKPTGPKSVNKSSWDSLNSASETF